MHLGLVAPYAANINELIEIDATTSRANTSTAVDTDFLILSVPAGAGMEIYIYPYNKIGAATNADPDGVQQCYVLYTLKDQLSWHT